MKKILIWIIALLVLCSVASAYADDYELLSDPVAYYNLDESGFVKDKSGNGYNGFLVDAPTHNSSGKINNSYTTDGANDVIKTLDLSNVIVGDGLTICFWYNTKNTAYGAFGAENGANNKYFFINPNADAAGNNPGRWRTTIDVGATNCNFDMDADSTIDYADGAYHFICVVANEACTTTAYYVDGVDQPDTITASNSIAGLDSLPFGFGARVKDTNTTYTDHYKMTIDEIYFYNVSLNADNISLLYNQTNAGLVPPFSAPTAQWSFGGNTHDDIVLETTTTTFGTNFTYNQSAIQNVTGTLVYNGTNITTTTTNLTANVTRLTASMSVPRIANTSLTLSFYYNVSFWNTTASAWHTLASNSLTQLAHQIHLYNCSSTANNRTLNFFIRDEVSDAALNGSFEATFQVWIDTYANRRNHSFDLDDGNNYSICLSPGWANYTTDMDAQYSSTGYVIRPYYLDDTALNNISQDIYLYLLNDSLDTIVLLYVEDELGTPLDDVIIKVQRWFPGEGLYKTIEVTRTDPSGAAVSHLVLYEVPYKFIFEREGEVLATTSPIYIDSTTKRFPIQLGDDLAEGWTKTRLITQALTFNNATNNFKLEYTDTQNIVRSVCLHVERITTTRIEQICHTCSNSTSASILCNVGATTAGRSFIATAWVKSSTNYSWYNTGILPQDFTTDLFGTDGLIMAMFLIGTFGMMGAMWKPRYSVGGSLVGLTISKLFGLWHLNIYYFVGITALGVVIIFLMKD